MSDSRNFSGFFAVDRRTWARVCGLCLNRAVAYLVLARGTGKSNRETAWSVQAIETYTGISRSRAHAAVAALIKDGVLRKLRDGTRPKYELVPWHLIPGTDPRPALSSYGQSVVDKALQGKKSRGGTNGRLPTRSTKVGLRITATGNIPSRRVRILNRTGYGCLMSS